MFRPSFGSGGSIVTAILVVGALVLPASASAGTGFNIDDPADGSIVNSIPSPPLLTAVLGWTIVGTPYCDYNGAATPGLDADPGALCNATPMQPAVDGDYTLTVTADVDEVPPTGVLSDFDTVSFEFDDTSPVVAISSPANHAQLAQKRPTVQFTATDANAMTHDCFLSPGSIDWEPCGSATSYTPAFDLADGSYTLQVRATDAATNLGYAAALFTVDNTAPTVNVTYPTPNAIVDSSVPEINMAVDGATAGSFCRYDAQAYQSCAASWLGGSLTDGAHTLSVRAVDVAGNETVVVVPFFVDDSFATGPLPRSVSLTNSRSAKVKRGKFKVKSGLAVLPSDLNFLAQSCKGSVTFSIKPKVKRAKTYSKRVSLKLSGNRCKTSGSVTLPAKYKGKRATLTARYHGSMLISSFRRTRSIKKL